jgi:PD-(D/E)XK nuclease superfamily protein
MGRTQDIGLLGQTSILNRFVQLGFEVLLPWNSSLGYDLAYLVEKEERHFGFFTFKTIEIVRVQCKVARLTRDGSCLIFNTATATEWGRKKKGYRGRAEWFGVYSPDTEKVYMVNVWEATECSEMRLRLIPAKNNQEKNVKWARDFEI